MANKEKRKSDPDGMECDGCGHWIYITEDDEIKPFLVCGKCGYPTVIREDLTVGYIACPHCQQLVVLGDFDKIKWTDLIRVCPHCRSNFAFEPELIQKAVKITAPTEPEKTAIDFSNMDRMVMIGELMSWILTIQLYTPKHKKIKENLVELALLSLDRQDLEKVYWSLSYPQFAEEKVRELKQK
jgi:DNA-directed RNA polymerase subunit M/transcription elongation factor TFIIS